MWEFQAAAIECAKIADPNYKDRAGPPSDEDYDKILADIRALNLPDVKV